MAEINSMYLQLHNLTPCPYRPYLISNKENKNRSGDEQTDAGKKEEWRDGVSGVDAMDGVDSRPWIGPVPPPALYVSTTLQCHYEHWDGLLVTEEHPNGRYATGLDLTQDGIAYRRLDAVWYGWLYQRMAKAKAAHVAGRLPTDTWDALRARFATIHAWAIAHGVIP